MPEGYARESLLRSLNGSGAPEVTNLTTRLNRGTLDVLRYIKLSHLLANFERPVNP